MKGFTLVEMIVVLGAAAVVGSLMANILVNNNSFFYKQNAVVSEGLSLNEITAKITSDLRQAVGVDAGYSDGSVNYTTGTQTLVFRVPASGSGGILDNVYDHIVVAKDAAQPKILRIRVFPDSQSSRPPRNLILTTILSSIEFGFWDKAGNTVAPTAATVISATVTVQPQTGSIGSSRSASVTTTLRNL